MVRTRGSSVHTQHTDHHPRSPCAVTFVALLHYMHHKNAIATMEGPRSDMLDKQYLVTVLKPCLTVNMCFYVACT